MNPAQLVLTGCAGFVPFEVVASQLAFTDDQRFALAPRPPHALADRHSPLRFRSADLKEKAEALLAARARAFGALADADQAAL
jgi:hypothetical protein